MGECEWDKHRSVGLAPRRPDSVPAHSLGLSLALGEFARDGVGSLGGRGRELRRRDGGLQVAVVGWDLDADRCEHA